MNAFEGMLKNAKPLKCSSEKALRPAQVINLIWRCSVDCSKYIKVECFFHRRYFIHIVAFTSSTNKIKCSRQGKMRWRTKKGSLLVFRMHSMSKTYNVQYWNTRRNTIFFKGDPERSSKIEARFTRISRSRCFNEVERKKPIMNINA